MGENKPEMEAIVKLNQVSGTGTLSAVEWSGMEAAMAAEERLTHRNLSLWMHARAQAIGVAANADEPEDDDNDANLARMLGEEALGDDAAVGDDKDSDDEGDAAASSTKKAEQEEEDNKAVGTIEKEKNWSAVNVVYKESKLPFR